jgi:hypothetical protein
MKALKTTGVGAAAIAAILLLVVTAGMLPQARSLTNSANPWNSRAIHSTFAGVQVHEIDASKAELIFLYDLENNSASDYQLSKGPGVLIMSRLKSSGSLSSDKQITLASSAFVPAKNRTRIELKMAKPFNWPARMDTASQARIRQLVDAELADLSGFVLFDQDARYQIELPGTWPAPGKETY